MAGIPAAEVEIEVPLVRALLAEQCPELAGLPVTPFANGWDNATFRLGDRLLVRLPRRAVAAPLILSEQRWLPVLGGLLPVPVPVPLVAGRAGSLFPYPWSVVPLLPGRVLAEIPVARRTVAASSLAAVFAGLHVPAPAEAPANGFRGVALSLRAAPIEHRLADTPGFGARAVAAFRAWSAAPTHAGPALWLHGDAHPLNLLIGDSTISGVLDWGDLTSGDPASDLATAWLTFDAAGRTEFIARCRAGGRYDEAVWDRAKAWALALASAFVAHGDDMPTLAAVGRHAVGELLGRPNG